MLVSMYCQLTPYVSRLMSRFPTLSQEQATEIVMDMYRWCADFKCSPEEWLLL